MEDKSLKEIADELHKGGWIIALLGAVGMLARLLITKERYSFIGWTRAITAGGITGVLMYFALYNAQIDPMIKSVLYSTSGALAPELFELLISRFKRKVL